MRIGRLSRRGLDYSTDADATLSAAVRDPRTRLLAVSRDGIAFLSDAARAGESLVWLGQTPDERHWVASLGWAGDEDELDWSNLRTILAEGDEDFTAIATQATALARWHDDHGYSPVDGSAVRPVHAGWALQDAGDRLHFPRTDPAVIVAIATQDDERLLLASNTAWDENRFSLIAGFVDPGESLESAVVRESLEEVGLELSRVRYVSSQPWPFPRSLMVGFAATATNPGDVHVDGVEIRDARWFTRAQLRSGAVQLPGSESIARKLIERWLAADTR
ncbi:MAG TPA: NAD(+) diphosphatase [Candidatus Agrococcus pullicola]|uniref:NAD(+) diphosphatase n=1 Tax=Candidatus Agrococcus pullicola TaxID=2838429 RepID=A0A9D1YWM5_9MICO|nr:NAD(+) diphosphatase [Candidatus Agrococcus pullicola]